MAITDPRLLDVLTRPVNEALLDRAIRHGVFLERFKTSEVNRIVGFLNREVFPAVTAKVDARMARIRARGLDTGPRVTQQLRELQTAVAGELASGMRAARGELTDGMHRFAQSEAEWAARTLGDQSKRWLDFDFTTPNARTLRSIVTARPMAGRVMRDWFRTMESSTRSGIMQAVNLGVGLGETTEQIVRRLRGTAANGFADGVYQTTRHNARTIVRTAVAHTSNHAREATYADNSEVVKAVQFVATLDDRTTFVCMGLDGQVFPINQGDRPPVHPQCRSTTVPVLRSWRELGIDLKEAPPNTRAALGGTVPGDVTYKGWFAAQDAALQREILGPSRYGLWKQGKVDIAKLSDHRTGRPLTLRQLREREGLVAKPKRQRVARPTTARPKPAPVVQAAAHPSGKQVREALIADKGVAAATEKLAELQTAHEASLKAALDIRTEVTLLRRKFGTITREAYQAQDKALRAKYAAAYGEWESLGKQVLSQEAAVAAAARPLLEVRGGTMRIEWVNDATVKRRRGPAKAALSDARGFLQSVVSRDLIDRLPVESKTTRKGRAFATRGEIHMGSQSSTRHVVHELGHVMELGDRVTQQQANRFLYARAAADANGPRPARLRHLDPGSNYGLHEVAWRDEFINPYMGKDYRPPGAKGTPPPALEAVGQGTMAPTEILSMGLELLYADPVGFARKDPAYFEWLVDLIRGLRP